MCPRTRTQLLYRLIWNFDEIQWDIIVCDHPFSKLYRILHINTNISSFHRRIEYISLPRQCGIEFGVFVDNMVKLLFAHFQLCFHYTHTFFRNHVVFVSTIPTIIRQFVTIVRVDLDIQHIGAFRAKLHFIL